MAGHVRGALCVPSLLLLLVTSPSAVHAQFCSNWANCDVGFIPKANWNAVQCGGAAPTCSNNLCCDYTCNNAAFSCTVTTFLPAPAQQNIRCGATISTCTNALCCLATCNGYGACGAAQMLLKQNPATVACTTSTAASCTTAICCDQTCANGLWGACAAQTLPVPNNAAVRCTAGAPCTQASCCNPTCTSHFCGTGLTLKAAPAGIVCASNACTNAECCDVSCSAFVCVNQGYVAISPPPSCGGVACNHATCCQLTCTGHVCPAGYIEKQQAANTLNCAGGTCVTVECCDLACDSFACTGIGGYVNKAGNENLRCVNHNCDRDTCCDATCQLFTCSSPGYVSKANSPLIRCGSTSSTCTADACCDITCTHARFSCDSSIGYTNKQQQGSIRCGASVNVCTPIFLETCCDYMCDHSQFTCPTPGFTNKANIGDIYCGTSLADCTTSKCCDATCANTGFQCTAFPGYVNRANNAAIGCGGPASSCSVSVCCEATCDGYTCQPGHNKKSNPTSLLCGTPAQCSSAFCCLATCTTYSCPTPGYKAVTTPGAQLCGTQQHSLPDNCNVGNCCTVTCDNSGFSCANAPGYVDKQNQWRLDCGARVADCTPTRCCDATCAHAAFTCTTGYVNRANMASITCGATPSACTLDTCCQATCDNNRFVCPLGYISKPSNPPIVCGDTWQTCSVVQCCNARICGANQRVFEKACVACEPGSQNAMGDSAAGGDTQCDHILCGQNFFVDNHECRPCRPGSSNMRQDDATKANTFCDVTLCARDYRVQANRCTPCARGSTNDANDRAVDGDTVCDPVLCGANERVSNHACQPCPSGSTNSPGDNALTTADTQCDTTVCRADQRVSNHACIACQPGTTSPAGSPATGTDTFCDAVRCGANQRVLNHECVPCPLGSTNEASDDSSGTDTRCDPVRCGVNQRVINHACAACAQGTYSDGNHDASAGDTLCVAIRCAENQRVASHACAACPPGSTNAAHDDASGVDTTCDHAFCGTNQKVLNHLCVACEPGSTNLPGDDATMGNTHCDTTFCQNGEHVQRHECIKCPNGFRNEAGQAATGPDTSCHKAASIRVEPTGIMTNERGSFAEFTVVLESKPFGDVRVPITSSDTGEGTVSKDSVTFTPSNWGGVQTVRVTGVQDAVDDGDVTFSINVERAVSSDASYNGLDPTDVIVTNVDDDTVGVSVSPLSDIVTSEAGAVATFSIALHTQPTDTVTIDVSSTDPTEGAVSPSTITFHPHGNDIGQGHWSAPQVVTVRGVDDFISDGVMAYAIVTGSTVSKDPLYNGINPPDLQARNLDNDVAGLRTIPVTSLLTSEDGGVARLTVELVSQPAQEVEAFLGVSNAREARVAPNRVVFTAANWNVPVTVTATGLDDDVDDGDVQYNVTLTTQSTEAAYSGVTWPGRTLINVDNDKAAIRLVQEPNLLVAENGTFGAAFTLMLTSAPVAPVTVDVTSEDLTEGQVSPPRLTFNAGNWNTGQVVNVLGVQDDVSDGNVQFRVKMGATSSTDANYDGLPIPSVIVTSVDDDTAAIAVTPTSGLNTSEAGAAVSFTVRILTQPMADVTVGLTSSDHTEGVTDVASVVFTEANWRDVKTVRVTGVDDKLDDGDVPYEIVTGHPITTDESYRQIDPPNVRLHNIDNDVASISVTPKGGLITTEAGGTATFNVSLGTQPTADVLIRFFSSDTSEGQLEPSQTLFTASNWEGVRVITVKGVQDAVDDGHVSFTISSSGPVTSDLNYARLTVPEVSVLNHEDDVAGITVEVPGGTLATSESGNTSHFRIELNTQPTEDVTIRVKSLDETEASINPAVIVFTDGTTSGGSAAGRGHWGVPQTITVTGVDDSEADGAVTFSIAFDPAESADPRYNGMTLARITGVNADNDAARVDIGRPSGAEVSETGMSVTFTAVLSAQPSAAVRCEVQSSDPTEAQVGVGALVFNPSDWNVPQTVKVTGVDDSVYDGDVSFQVKVLPCLSADARFNGFDPEDFTLRNLDIDSAGAYLLTVFSLQQAGDSAALCARMVMEVAAKWGISEGHISGCRVKPSSPQTGVNYDVVTVEIHELGPKLAACDKLRGHAANINAVRSQGITLAGRVLADTETRTVHCPRTLCSTFGAANCASGTLLATKVCANEVCDALTCCEPGQVAFTVFKSSRYGHTHTHTHPHIHTHHNATDVTLSITRSRSSTVQRSARRLSAQAAPSLSTVPCTATSTPTWYASTLAPPTTFLPVRFMHDSHPTDTHAHTQAYVRPGFNSIDSCGSAVGSLDRLTADPTTVVFPCECKKVSAIPLDGQRTCSPVQRGYGPLNYSKSAQRQTHTPHHTVLQPFTPPAEPTSSAPPSRARAATTRSSATNGGTGCC